MGDLRTLRPNVGDQNLSLDRVILIEWKLTL